jgi:arylsulfatase A-like enzyme
VATLAETLSEHGYRTGAFVTNINVAPQWGFQRGFDVYRYLAEDERSPTVHVGADVVNAQALDWLSAASDRPYFLYVHATDPHAPYRPPSPWAERFVDPDNDVPPARIDTLLGAIREHGVQPTADEVRALMARYDGEIAFTDGQFGRFVTELRRRGLLERTLIVLVADHGEEFGDHGGFEHGRTLYEEMLHVPLIVRLPNPEGAGRRVAESVRQIDIAPTVLEYVGAQVPADLPGRSLLGALTGVAPPSVDALADTSLGRQRVAAVMTGDWKVIDEKVGSSAKTQVYNISQDEREREDLAEQHPVLVGYARQALAASVAGGSAPPADNAVEPVVDPAILERLRALGYRD